MLLIAMVNEPSFGFGKILAFKATLFRLVLPPELSGRLPVGCMNPLLILLPLAS
jgi:hypothetical protein